MTKCDFLKKKNNFGVYILLLILVDQFNSEPCEFLKMMINLWWLSAVLCLFTKYNNFLWILNLPFEKLTTHITIDISASIYAINNQAHYSIMSNLVQFFLKSDINFECFMISHKNDSTNRKTTGMNVQITKVWCKIIWTLFPIS